MYYRGNKYSKPQLPSLPFLLCSQDYSCLCYASSRLFPDSVFSDTFIARNQLRRWCKLHKLDNILSWALPLQSLLLNTLAHRRLRTLYYPPCPAPPPPADFPISGTFECLALTYLCHSFDLCHPQREVDPCFLWPRLLMEPWGGSVCSVSRQHGGRGDGWLVLSIQLLRLLSLITHSCWTDKEIDL